MPTSERTDARSEFFGGLAKVLLTSAAGLLENNNPAALIGRGVRERGTDEAVQWSSKLKHSERRTAIILWLQGSVCFTGHNEQAAAAPALNSAVPDQLVHSLARRTEKRGISLKTSIYMRISYDFNVALFKKNIYIYCSYYKRLI